MDRIQCTYCILGSNNLAGAIPPQIVELKVITVFNLSSNKLHGTDPQSICNLFSLEYAGELCIFVLRRRKDPITETISPLGSERGGDKTLLGLLQTNAGPDQIHMQPYKPQRTSCTLFLHSIYSWMMYYCSNSRPV
jgi:hypothetical protein